MPSSKWFWEWAVLLLSAATTLFFLFYVPKNLDLSLELTLFGQYLLGPLIATGVFIWAGFKFAKLGGAGILKSAISTLKFAFRYSVIFALLFFVVGIVTMYSGISRGGIGGGLMLASVPPLAVIFITIQGLLCGLLGAAIFKIKNRLNKPRQVS